MPSIQRTIRKSLSTIIQSEDATTGERLEACKLLLRIQAATTKGQPRGRGFAKKANGEPKDQRERIERLLSGNELIACQP
jgi:hypothetical protein